MRKQIIILPLLLFLFILLIFFYLLIIDRDPAKVPSALIEKEVPVFHGKSLFNEKKFISSDELKNENIIVNFFATWCKPCREEHPFIKRLAKENNIKIIGINYKDNPEDAIKWLNELGNPYYDVILDLNGRIGIDWGVYGIPETFIVNSKGIIKYRHLGPINSDFYDTFYLKFLTK